MSSSMIWVKVITANPLKGPCEGQVQFLTHWERRKARLTADPYTVTFSFGGKTHKHHAWAGAYATVKANFELHMPSVLVIDWYITMGDMKYDLSSFLPGGKFVDNPSRESYDKASDEQPPKMRWFRVYVSNENGERSIEDRVQHWDAWALCRSMIGKYFKPYWAKQARNNGIEGDDQVTCVSVYGPNEQCDTLYCEEDGYVDQADITDSDDVSGDPDRLDERFRQADGPDDLS